MYRWVVRCIGVSFCQSATPGGMNQHFAFASAPNGVAEVLTPQASGVDRGQLTKSFRLKCGLSESASLKSSFGNMRCIVKRRRFSIGLLTTIHLGPPIHLKNPLFWRLWVPDNS